jgi:hypothetical protein
MISTLTELHAEQDGLETRLLVLGEEAADIKRQLGNAKTTGNYDRRWFAAAESALRFKNVERQRLQSELGKINEKIREAHGRAQDRRFADIAKRKLPPELFQSILAELTGRDTISA